MSKKLLVLAVIAILVASLVPSVFAQTVPSAAPTVRNCTALSPEEALHVVQNLGGAPDGSRLLAVYYCTGFATNVVGDTTSVFETACANIAIYKVQSTGRQGWWNVPGRVCSGNSLSLVTQGTGHYIVYDSSPVSPDALTKIIVGGA